MINDLSDPRLDELLGSQADELREDIELIEGAANPFEIEHYLKGNQTPGLLRQRHQQFRRQGAARRLRGDGPAARPTARPSPGMVSP